MDRSDAIRLEGISRRFSRRWALRGVSLRAEVGESLMLVGRNGSGKTTLLRVLSTALGVTRGHGSVFGHDLRREPDGVRALTACLGHHAGLYGDLTAYENLAFAERMRRPELDATRSDARIRAVLERVGLASERDERTRGFSAGMKRRLALGRVLLAEARLLLLDEPYTSFDAAGIDLVNEVVTQAVAAGGCVVVATHDPDRAAGVATRAVRMEDGVLLEEALPLRQGAAVTA